MTTTQENFDLNGIKRHTVLDVDMWDDGEGDTIEILFSSGKVLRIYSVGQEDLPHGLDFEIVRKPDSGRWANE